ncbi:MAG: HD domain-containing protein [Nitrosopumilaceae archaeon]
MDGLTPYTAHLESVVSYLKSLGITDEDVLCSGWLHDTIEDTDTTFDDLYERFGKKVAILVSSLSKDEKLPKKDRERLYVKQLKDASLEAKIIKLWDISANLKDLAISGMSKSKRKRTANQKLHYLKVIKNDIIENKSNYPKISNLIKGINYVLVKNGQKSVLI